MRTAKEDLQHWDSILDEYEKSLSFPSYSTGGAVSENEINDYLSMSRDQIEKLSPEDCAQISYRLAQCAFHIQRSINREIARLNWSEETAKETVAEEINNYKGYGYIEKFYQAVKHNEKAAALQNIKKYAKQRIDRLSYIANNFKNLSDIMLSVQKTKVKHGS